MEKHAEKRYTFKIIVNGKGERGIRWDPNQGLEGACHAASDALNEGAAVSRKVWEDKARGGPPDDIQRDRQQNQQQA